MHLCRLQLLYELVSISAQRTPGRSGFEQYCKKDAIQFITAWKENVAYPWYMAEFLFVGNASRGLVYFQPSINMQEVLEKFVLLFTI